MGQRPTDGNENPHRRRPREGGDPRSADSRVRGNDAHKVIFRRAAGGPERSEGGISQCLENTQSEIPRSARNDSLGRAVTQTLGERVALRRFHQSVS